MPDPPADQDDEAEDDPVTDDNPDPNAEVDQSRPSRPRTVPELRLALSALHLPTTGKRITLLRRLRSHIPPPPPAAPLPPRDPSYQPHDLYLVCDVEATCERDNPRYPHEIIELPIVVVDGRTGRMLGKEFRRYVRPVINPKLSGFCVELTGIRQEDVDGAAEWAEVLGEMEVWVQELIEAYYKDRSEEIPAAPTSTPVFITDGPWDIDRFVTLQSRHSSLPLPPLMRSYIDLRRLWSVTHPSPSNGERWRRPGIVGMLGELGLEFEGRQHCGLDDTRNIARIVVGLMERGVTFERNAGRGFTGKKKS
ncbi:3'-5' exoribonuclease 1 [Irineochytrium annulatum]|nr:3'-5' exoribonuclease 1 [Irineochytrium annulatum]